MRLVACTCSSGPSGGWRRGRGGRFESLGDLGCDALGDGGGLVRGRLKGFLPDHLARAHVKQPGSEGAGQARDGGADMTGEHKRLFIRRPRPTTSASVASGLSGSGLSPHCGLPSFWSSEQTSSKTSDAYSPALSPSPLKATRATGRPDCRASAAAPTTDSIAAAAVSMFRWGRPSTEDKALLTADAISDLSLLVTAAGRLSRKIQLIRLKIIAIAAMTRTKRGRWPQREWSRWPNHSTRS